MGGGFFHPVVQPGTVADNLRHVRCGGSGQCGGHVTARQTLSGRGSRLDGALHVAARAVFCLRVTVGLSVFQLVGGHLRMYLTRFLQRIYLTLRAGDIRHLAADFPDKLRLLHSALLFLLIEDGVDAAVCIRRVAAQVRHVLRLMLLIANHHRAVFNGRTRGALRAAAAVRPDQQVARHIPGELPRDAAAGAAPGADARALVLHVVFSGVMDIPPAERPGVEAVVIRRGGGGDNRAVELRVAADGDVEPAGACEDTALLLHGGVVAVHPVAAVINAGGAAHGAEGEAAARAGVLLAAVVTVGVLFTGNGQVAPDIGQHALPADLRPGEIRIAAADDCERIPRVNRGFGAGGAVAALGSFAAVHAGGDGDARTTGAVADTDARAAAVALVLAVERGGVQCGNQVHVPAGL